MAKNGGLIAGTAPTGYRMLTSAEAKGTRDYRRAAGKIGESEAFTRFMMKYGNVRTKGVYAVLLSRYLRWLKSRGVTLTPDQLVEDNLRCVYESKAVDVKAKRTHTDWLDDYINRYLVEEGVSESTRMSAAAVVKEFYAKNDSQLFGSFQVARGSVRVPPPPLKGEEIRRLLKALPLQNRLPLLMVWQSGVEIGRVLALTWKDVRGVDEGEHPVKLQFYGRKKHRKPYATFLGTDSIEGLKLWRMSWCDKMGRPPSPDDLIFLDARGAPLSTAWLNERMKKVASTLAKGGLIEKGDLKSWHTHGLRHSFETEASHAGVRAEIRDYFMGHVTGIQWTYNHRDELHPEDLVIEYLKVEPYVSLDPAEAVWKERLQEKEKETREEIRELWRVIGCLKTEVSQAVAGAPPLPQ